MKNMVLVCIALILVAGCHHDKKNGKITPTEGVIVLQPENQLPPPAPSVPYIASLTARDGLELRLELPGKKTSFVPGETFEVKITAINRSGRPLHISGREGSPWFIYIWWLTNVGWEGLRTYPESSLVVSNQWKLKIGQVREFLVKITVDPGWPTFVPLAIVTRLNGRKDPVPVLPIHVYRPGSQEKIDSMKLREIPSREDIEKALSL